MFFGHVQILLVSTRPFAVPGNASFADGEREFDLSSLNRKLSTYALCRDPMLDSMCLLSICKQLFSAKSPLRKEAMKAVQEWNIDSSDRSRAQVSQPKEILPRTLNSLSLFLSSYVMVKSFAFSFSPSKAKRTKNIVTSPFVF